MKVLVGCEFSGIVRDAFARLGHEALSCDFLPTERSGPHYIGDVRDILFACWDLMIAHPPCNDLSVSGSKHFHAKRLSGRQARSIAFFMELISAPIPHIAIENPVGVMSSLYRKPDQIIQPWQFGHGETKATCLWLKNLPPLHPTTIVEGRENRILALGPSAHRWKLRSITYQGIANAMAKQWGTVEGQQSELFELDPSMELGH